MEDYYAKLQLMIVNNVNIKKCLMETFNIIVDEGELSFQSFHRTFSSFPLGHCHRARCHTGTLLRRRAEN